MDGPAPGPFKKDGERRTIPLWDVARQDFNEGLTVADSPMSLMEEPTPTRR